MISTIISPNSYNQPFQVTLLTILDIINILNISRSTYYRLKEQPNFPKPINLGARTVRYNSTEIFQWIDQHKNKH